MKEKPTIKSATTKAAQSGAQGKDAKPAASDGARDESERRIDEIAERHRETLERLARG